MRQIAISALLSLCILFGAISAGVAHDGKNPIESELLMMAVNEQMDSLYERLQELSTDQNFTPHISPVSLITRYLTEYKNPEEAFAFYKRAHNITFHKQATLKQWRPEAPYIVGYEALMVDLLLARKFDMAADLQSLRGPPIQNLQAEKDAELTPFAQGYADTLSKGPPPCIPKINMPHGCIEGEDTESALSARTYAACIIENHPHGCGEFHGDGTTDPYSPLLKKLRIKHPDFFKRWPQ